MIKCKKEGIFLIPVVTRMFFVYVVHAWTFSMGKKGEISFHHGFKMLGLIPTAEERAYFQNWMNELLEIMSIL